MEMRSVLPLALLCDSARCLLATPEQTATTLAWLTKITFKQ
jgi:hypothetical protein